MVQPVGPLVWNAFMQSQRDARQRQLEGLQKLRGVLAIRGAMQQQQAAQERQRHVAKLSGVLAGSDGNGVLSTMAQIDPKAVLPYVLAKPSGPYTLSPDQVRFGADNAPLASLPNPQLVNLGNRLAVVDKNQLQPGQSFEMGVSPSTVYSQGQQNVRHGTPSGSAIYQKEGAIARLESTGIPRHVAIGIVDGRYAVSRDPISGQAHIIDKASGVPVGGGSASPTPAQATAPQPPSTAIPSDTNASLATGPSGFFGGLGNTIVEAFGGSAPAPKVEQATQALNNLQTQTITGLQSAVPGRPSVFLLEQLQKLSVTPNSLLMGDDRARTRLQQTRALITTEIARMQRDILANPGQFRPKEISETRANVSQLSGILREYDTVLKGFGGGAKPQEGQEAASRSGRPMIYRNGRWEYK